MVYDLSNGSTSFYVYIQIRVRQQLNSNNTHKHSPTKLVSHGWEGLGGGAKNLRGLEERKNLKVHNLNLDFRAFWACC